MEIAKLPFLRHLAFNLFTEESIYRPPFASPDIRHDFGHEPQTAQDITQNVLVPLQNPSRDSPPSGRLFPDEET
jgi:hypothetical protein